MSGDSYYFLCVKRSRFGKYPYKLNDKPFVSVNSSHLVFDFSNSYSLTHRPVVRRVPKVLDSHLSNMSNTDSSIYKGVR